MTRRPKRKVATVKAPDKAELKGIAKRFESLAQYVPRARRGEAFEQWWDGLPISEQRLQTIMDMMATGRWLSNVSHKMLAHQWGLTPAAVASLAKEAARTIARVAAETPEQRDEILGEILRTFQLVRAKALGLGDANGLRVALEATKLYGQWLGMEPMPALPTRSRDDLDNWTEEELKAFIAEGRDPNEDDVATESKPTNGNDEDDARPVH